MSYELNVNGKQVIAEGSTKSFYKSNQRQEVKYTSYFNVGYAAALGVEFTVGKICLYCEVNTTGVPFKVKKSVIESWGYSVNYNGLVEKTNLLSGLTVSERETVYKKNYSQQHSSDSWDPDDINSPSESTSFSLPANNIGIAVGVTFKF